MAGLGKNCAPLTSAQSPANDSILRMNSRPGFYQVRVQTHKTPPLSCCDAVQEPTLDDSSDAAARRSDSSNSQGEMRRSDSFNSQNDRSHNLVLTLTVTLTLLYSIWMLTVLTSNRHSPKACLAPSSFHLLSVALKPSDSYPVHRSSPKGDTSEMQQVKTWAEGKTLVQALTPKPLTPSLLLLLLPILNHFVRVSR